MARHTCLDWAVWLSFPFVPWWCWVYVNEGIHVNCGHWGAHFLFPGLCVFLGVPAELGR